ncbi:P-loop containing nucleoside triphosphate hydrolase protein, partial [Rhodotorula sp. JG-1b]
LFSRVKLLFPYLWPAKSLVLQILALICFGLMLFRRYVNVLQPILFGRVISALANGRPPFVPIVLYVIFSFLQDSNTMLTNRCPICPPSTHLTLGRALQYSEREMALMSFDILLNLSLSYHTRRRTGELLRILSRSEAINDFFELLLFSFVPILIDLPVAFLVLWVRYGITIVGVVTVVAVVYVTTSVTLAESRTKLYRALRDESQFMHQLKSDVLFNYETTKIFVSENFEMKRLRDAMWKYQRGYFNVFNSWQSLSLLQNSISAFGLLVCSFILSRRVIEGEMDVGNYVAFVSYLNQLYSPLNQISSLYRRVMNNAVDTEQLIELLNEEREISDRPNPVELKIDPSEGAEIEFKDVTFSYDKKVPVLKGVSFKVGRGQSVALVGPSGGGKSTITKLIYRFYDVSSGSISINGHDIRDLTQRSLRASIGLVPQESVLFNSSARMNIAYGGINRLDLDGRGSERITMDEVVEAAKAAAIHDKIMSFPDVSPGRRTRVRERGQRLSGGEKQRVSIARTILKDPPILVLDEATSALDTFNERLIQNRLRELLQGRTSIIIAHRLSTIVDCDVIHVLKDGLIVESGSHNELIARGGVYAGELARPPVSFSRACSAQPE